MSELLPSNDVQVGNPDAAQDLYGLGVRVGLYLQTLGMILYTYSASGRKRAGKESRTKPDDTGKGLKIASGSIATSVLVSWFVFAAKATFSPCEAVLVLILLTGVAFPAKQTLLNPHTIVGEIVGLVVMLLVELGICAALLWTFSVLVVNNNLPLLDTENLFFFFVPVALDGWFRIVALIFSIIDAITSLQFGWRIIRVAALALRISKKNEATPSELIRIEKIIGLGGMDAVNKVLPWVVLVLAIVAVELTIHFNRLSPTTDLQAPGQLIPLVVGVIVLLDACFGSARDLGEAVRGGAKTALAKLQQFVTWLGTIFRFGSGSSAQRGQGV